MAAEPPPERREVVREEPAGEPVREREVVREPAPGGGGAGPFGIVAAVIGLIVVLLVGYFIIQAIGGAAPDGDGDGGADIEMEAPDDLDVDADVDVDEPGNGEG